MKTLKILFSFALVAMSVLIAKSQVSSDINATGLFRNKYTKNQVWDVQRSPAYPVAGQNWVLSGLAAPLDGTGSTIDWGNGRYLKFVGEVDNSNGPKLITDDVFKAGTKYNVTLRLFESNDVLVKVVSRYGQIIGMGNQGFMYEEEGQFGTFFSVNQVNSSTIISYKPVVDYVNKRSELIKGNAELGKGVVNTAVTNVINKELPKVNLDIPFINLKYTKQQVWDVQRSPAFPVAGQEWTLSGLQGALDASGASIDWGYNRYVSLVPEPDMANGAKSLVDDKTGAKYKVALKLYESNGKLVKVISNSGKIFGMGAQGFMYENEGAYGTFFSPYTVNATTVIKYKPVYAEVTKLSDFTKINVAKQAELPKTTVDPTAIATGYYVLTARCSNKVLDVLDASTKEGGTIQQWKLNGNIAQHWKIEPAIGASGYYVLTARCSGKALDVDGSSKQDGAKIHQWTRNGRESQQWKLDPVAGAPGYYILTAKCSGKVLDVLDASKLDGAKVQQWSLNGNIAQHWKLTPVK